MSLAELTATIAKVNGSLVLPPSSAPGVSTVTPMAWGPYPSGRLPYDEIGSVALPVMGAGDTPVLTFIVPNGFDGVIHLYSVNFMGGGFVQGSGDIIWRILRNGAPVRNFENITSERGSIATPRPIANIQLYATDIVTIVVNHAANAGLNGQVIVSMNGYYYPVQG